jgi:hypothetical protein
LTVGNKQGPGSAVCGTSSVPLLTFRASYECTCWSHSSTMFIRKAPRTDRVEHSISNHHQDHNQDKSFFVSSSLTCQRSSRSSYQLQEFRYVITSHCIQLRRHLCTQIFKPRCDFGLMFLSRECQPTLCHGYYLSPSVENQQKIINLTHLMLDHIDTLAQGLFLGTAQRQTVKSLI